jgi:hypothetical protein
MLKGNNETYVLHMPISVAFTELVVEDVGW